MLRFTNNVRESTQLIQDHWFGFLDACVSVREFTTSGSRVSPADSTALLFLHGRFSDRTLWTETARALAPQFRCFCLDLPGFGGSYSVGDRGLSILQSSRLVERIILDFIPDPSVVLVGHDIGGAIAQISALSLPERVPGLILLNSPCISWTLDRVPTHRAGRALHKALRRLLKSSGIRDASGVSQSLSDGLTRPSLAKAVENLQESWPEAGQRDVWKSRLQAFTKPTLLLWGSRDPLDPPEIAAHLLSSLPEAYLSTHERCGHWLPLEDPEWVSEKVRGFLHRTHSLVKGTRAS